MQIPQLSKRAASHETSLAGTSPGPDMIENSPAAGGVHPVLISVQYKVKGRRVDDTRIWVFMKMGITSAYVNVYLYTSAGMKMGCVGAWEVLSLRYLSFLVPADPEYAVLSQQIRHP